MADLYDRIVGTLNRAYDYLIVEHPDAIPSDAGNCIEDLLKHQEARVLERILYDKAGDDKAYLVLKLVLNAGCQLDVEGLFALLPMKVRLYHFASTLQID